MEMQVVEQEIFEEAGIVFTVKKNALKTVDEVRKGIKKILNSKEIPERCFLKLEGFTQITIPINIISIGNNAFWGCIDLIEIIIPDSVTSIGNRTFGYCKSLTQITIPSSVNSIGKWAFSGCSGLKQITIPSNVNSIGDGAFNGCINLQEINIPQHIYDAMGRNYNDVCEKLRLPNNIKMLVDGNEINSSAKDSIFDKVSSRPEEPKPLQDNEPQKNLDEH